MTAKRAPISPGKLPPLVNADGEVRELTDEDFKHFRPSSEFPELAAAFKKMRGQRGPQQAPLKDRIGLRLDHDVVEYFRSTGPGWQSRINDILADHVKKQS